MTLTETDLNTLYETDETAWLDAMAEIVREGNYSDLDFNNLEEFLTSMARRDRQAIESRLLVLLMHTLKWIHQPEKQSGSWKASILAQRNVLRRDIARGVLRTHAREMLPEIYRNAVEAASAETALDPITFPAHCPWTLEDVLAFDPV